MKKEDRWRHVLESKVRVIYIKLYGDIFPKTLNEHETGHSKRFWSIGLWGRPHKAKCPHNVGRIPTHVLIKRFFKSIYIYIYIYIYWIYIIHKYISDIYPMDIGYI